MLAKIIGKFSKFSHLNEFYLSFLRNVQRKNITNPKRFLIYVIYENQERLQEYKILFLEALVNLSDKVYIVVNGELAQEDISILQQYGNVELRENKGYDVAAFRHGILKFTKTGFKDYDELLLINDTSVGPFTNLKNVFDKMNQEKLDFWGISYGEIQSDITGYNKYKHIPLHIQSYFLVIKKSLLNYNGFHKYWENLKDTDSRNKAIGKHETVFTKHFSDLGFKHGAVTNNNYDSAMYIHPLEMLKEGVPLVKHAAFKNYNDDIFTWKGLKRKTEVPALINYIKQCTDYPISIIDKIMDDIKNEKHETFVLIIDGVENIIPQCTRYRVLNKSEQIASFGYNVHIVNNSEFELSDAQYASHIIIYRTPFSEKLDELCRLAKKYNKPIFYDIDDLVIDTKYTDMLEYIQNLSKDDKLNYDMGVNGYGKMLRVCDGAITTTSKLKEELQHYQNKVFLNRNLAGVELVEKSLDATKIHLFSSKKVKLGYFSGSITHNENFELIKPALIKILEKHNNVELYLVGHLSIPEELQHFNKQIKTKSFLDWQKLPNLISEIDINLAPLVDSIFNQAKSEIKWIEAALVKVPTLASNLGAFAEMVEDNQTGVLANEDEWYEKINYLIENPTERKHIAENAYQHVLKNCITKRHDDELLKFIKSAK